MNSLIYYLTPPPPQKKKKYIHVFKNSHIFSRKKVFQMFIMRQQFETLFSLHYLELDSLYGGQDLNMLLLYA